MHATLRRREPCRAKLGSDLDVSSPPPAQAPRSAAPSFGRPQALAAPPCALFSRDKIGIHAFCGGNGWCVGVRDFASDAPGFAGAAHRPAPMPHGPPCPVRAGPQRRSRMQGAGRARGPGEHRRGERGGDTLGHAAADGAGPLRAALRCGPGPRRLRDHGRSHPGEGAPAGAGRGGAAGGGCGTAAGRGAHRCPPHGTDWARTTHAGRPPADAAATPPAPTRAPSPPAVGTCRLPQ